MSDWGRPRGRSRKRPRSRPRSRPGLRLRQLVHLSFSFPHLAFPTVLVAASNCRLHSSPSPSIVVISSNSPLEYGEAEDIALIREDRYPFQMSSFLVISGDAATLAESFSTVYKANATTFKMLRGLADHWAAEDEVKAAHKHYCSAQYALCVLQLKVDV